MDAGYKDHLLSYERGGSGADKTGDPSQHTKWLCGKLCSSLTCAVLPYSAVGWEMLSRIDDIEMNE